MCIRDSHGIETSRLAVAGTVPVQVFRPAAEGGIERAERPFQGHHELRLRGSWTEEERRLPAGTVIVRSRQRLGRLAAQLLEPESEDSLSTWNFFEEATRESGEYPVLRLDGE